MGRLSRWRSVSSEGIRRQAYSRCCLSAELDHIGGGLEDTQHPRWAVERKPSKTDWGRSTVGELHRKRDPSSMVHTTHQPGSVCAWSRRCRWKMLPKRPGRPIYSQSRRGVFYDGKHHSAPQVVTGDPDDRTILRLRE